MKLFTTLFVALVAVLLCSTFVAADFEARCILKHKFADKNFNCTMYQQDVDDEYRLRIDVCYVEDGANSVCESIVQRFDRTVGADYRVSSQMIIGEPWTQWRRCCQHDALGTTPRPTLTPLVGETLEIVRSDNFTTIEITSVSATVPTDLEDKILLHWDDAEAFCDLRCATEADVVFSVDNSGSINANEFLLMKAFIIKFIDAFTISPSKTNLGIVLFGGQSSSSSDDVYYIVNVGSTAMTDNASAKTYFMTTAVTQADWADDIQWGNGTTNPAVDYYKWDAEGAEQASRGGIAYLELYLTPFEHEITNVMNKLGNGRARFSHGVTYGNTAMGTGLLLAHHLLFRNGNRQCNVGESNGFPRLLISMTDGSNNRGLSTVNAAALVLPTPNVTLIGIGIGPGYIESEVVNLSSPPNGGRTYNYSVVAFSDEQFNAVLTPLISGSCLGQSNNAVPCSASCATSNGMCTACGDCIQCTSDDDCPSCGFCSQSPFGTCVVDEAAAISKCSAPTPCQSIVCDPSRPRSDMCVVLYNDTVAIEAARVECQGANGDAPFDFDAETCVCSAQPGDGDGGVSAGAIAGGAAAGALVLLILLALLAALLVLLLLAALFIIVAVVIAAIVMLAFGVTMAIPPSITALEVTAPNQVVNEENPLAVDQMEWVESAAQDA